MIQIISYLKLLNTTPNIAMYVALSAGKLFNSLPPQM